MKILAFILIFQISFSFAQLPDQGKIKSKYKVMVLTGLKTERGSYITHKGFIIDITDSTLLIGEKRHYPYKLIYIPNNIIKKIRVKKRGLFLISWISFIGVSTSIVAIEEAESGGSGEMLFTAVTGFGGLLLGWIPAAIITNLIEAKNTFTINYDPSYFSEAKSILEQYKVQFER